MRTSPGTWPALPLEEWVDTQRTLHRWTQIVGKIRLALTPLVNHWWNVPLYVSARGLTTSAIPFGSRTFDIEFDFLAHVLRIRTSDGASRDLAMEPRSVADMYREIFGALASLDIECTIWPTPVEIATEALPLDTDEMHHSYDRGYAERFWTVLRLAEAVLTEFRARFVGSAARSSSTGEASTSR